MTNTTVAITRAKFNEIRSEHIEALKIRIVHLEGRIDTSDFMETKFFSGPRQDSDRDEWESELSDLRSELSSI